jgi:chemotaxis protein MotB
MKTSKNILMILGVTLISACSVLEQPPAPNDTVSRLSNEMKAVPRVVPPKPDPRDARIASLEKQLADRDAELARLRTAADNLSAANRRSSDLERQLADRDRELAALKGNAGDLGQANSRISDLERELATAQATSAASQLAASDLDKSKQEATDLQKELGNRNLRLASLEKQLADRDEELSRLRGDLSAEMQKLAQAQRGLVRALRPEIEKGDISVDLNSERLQINLASQYLFGLGEDQIKPDGVNALKQVGTILKDYPEYNVEVAGHTDNLAIRRKLKEKFPTNQALSEARAASAVTALTEGGIAANSLTAAGYAEAKPVAPNTTEEGRQKNRRVEIRVTPKS